MESQNVGFEFSTGKPHYQGVYFKLIANVAVHGVAMSQNLSVNVYDGIKTVSEAKTDDLATLQPYSCLCGRDKLSLIRRLV